MGRRRKTRRSTDPDQRRLRRIRARLQPRMGTHQQGLPMCLDAVAGEASQANAAPLVLVRPLPKCMWLPDAQPTPRRTLCGTPDAQPSVAPLVTSRGPTALLTHAPLLGCWSDEDRSMQALCIIAAHSPRPRCRLTAVVLADSNQDTRCDSRARLGADGAARLRASSGS